MNPRSTHEADGKNQEAGIVPAPFAKPRPGLMALAARDPDTAHDGSQSNPPPKDPATRARRSEKTEADYAARVKSMYRESERARTLDLEAPPIVSPVEVVQDLIESASGPTARRGPSSWNIYRSAMLWHLADNRHLNSAYEEAYQILLATKRPPGAKTKAEAPEVNAKRAISLRELDKLYGTLDGMAKRRSAWASQARLWFQAGLATGLRPVEWLRAEWAKDDDPVLGAVRHRIDPVGEGFDCWADDAARCPQVDIGQVRWLRIKNAKLKRVGSPLEIMEGRTGSIHEIPIEELPPGDFYDETRHWRYVPVDPVDAADVDEHMKCVHVAVCDGLRDGLPEAAAFKKYYDKVREKLTDACKLAFHGKHFYSLYCARSQFAANAKKTLPLEVVAQMMGHLGTRNTMSRYGPRSAAHAGGGRPMRDAAARRLFEATHLNADVQIDEPSTDEYARQFLRQRGGVG